ncbi:YybH family protein [Candidatus Neomarinimicrobiota bacterium]
MTKKSLIILVLLLIGCNKPVSIDMNKELMAVDMAFSTLSKEKGMNHAFLFYVADDGVMLSPNRMPIVGKNKIIDLFQSDDSKTVFTWNPLHAEVAKSGDLGYTYGTYEIVDGKSRQKGTYVSIWKKDTSGEWKFVLDSGNEGLGDQ